MATHSLAAKPLAEVQNVCRPETTISLPTRIPEDIASKVGQVAMAIAKEHGNNTGYLVCVECGEMEKIQGQIILRVPPVQLQ